MELQGSELDRRYSKVSFVVLAEVPLKPSKP
jgi:hypothetical protein